MSDDYREADQYIYVPAASFTGPARKLPPKGVNWVTECPEDVDARSLDNPYTLSYEETEEGEPYIIVGAVDGYVLDIDVDIGEDHDETFEGDVDSILTPEGVLAFLSASGGPHRMLKFEREHAGFSGATGVDLQGDMEGNQGVVTSPFHHPDYEITNEPTERVLFDNVIEDEDTKLNRGFNADLLIESSPSESDNVGPSSTYSGGEWYDSDTAREALRYIDPDVGYEEWFEIGLALQEGFPDGTAESLFKEWSRGGSKWDDKAERQAERIINDATPTGGVDMGKLFGKAKEGGWVRDSASRSSGHKAGGKAADGGTASASPESGPSIETRSDPLSPGAVKVEGGLGEDDDISDLPDREKAAIVWELIERSNEVHVRVRRDNGSLWAYDDGIWKAEGERALRHAARKALTAVNYGPKVLSILKEQARSDPRAEIEPTDFGTETGYVAVKNGLLNLDVAADALREGDDDLAADGIRELHPDDYALVRLPVEFEPAAEYDEWAGYVEEWAESGKADALAEYVGYCLHIGEMEIHRALLLVGSGANGKGTFLSVVRALLGGRENTTSIELQTLANEKDAVADFYGSLANIDDDLSSRQLGASGLGMFKKLVGGDWVRARSLYQSGFEYQATGKHLYAANEVPEVNVPDEQEAFWRRWLLVEFANYYPPKQRDPMLENRLTTDEALSGVLNWAILGRSRLLDQGYFTGEDMLAHDVRTRWQSWGDSIEEFISQCVERDEDAERMTTSEAYQRFEAWCRENEKSHDGGQQGFTNTLKQEDVGYGKHRINGVAGTLGYTALGLSDDVPEISNGDSDDDTQQGRL